MQSIHCCIIFYVAYSKSHAFRQASFSASAFIMKYLKIEEYTFIEKREFTVGKIRFKVIQFHLIIEH